MYPTYKTLLPMSAAVVLFAALAANASADQTVVIGHAAPLSGGIAALGKDSENGARLAVEEINEKGLTIGGQKVILKLDSEDDRGDPREATQVAQKFVDENVVAVVGHLNSGASIPASKVYSDAGITEISQAATNPMYTMQGFKTTYRLIGTDAQQGPALATYAATALKVKTVAIVDDSTAYGKGLADTFEARAKALGITVLSRDATSDQMLDFRSIITKIKAEHPDAVMYSGMYATGGPFAKQAAGLGLNAKILGGDGICSGDMPPLAGAGIENVICSAPGKTLASMPRGLAFANRYQKRFGQPIVMVAPVSYDAVYVIVDAMKRANSVDPAKVLAQMPSTAYQGVIGEISFDAKGDLKHSAISLFDFPGGKQTLLSHVDM